MLAQHHKLQIMASPESAAIAAHREAFYHEVEQLYSKYDTSHKIIKTREETDALIAFLSGPAKDKTVKKQANEYYAIANYVVMRGASTNETDYLITKKVFNDAHVDGNIDIMKIRRLAVWDDLFDIIRSHHLLRQHAAARNTWLSVKQSYSNISREVCEKFVKLCNCKVNQRLPGRPEGITPILSKTFNDRGQMDLIDMQSNVCDGYTWILHYQDHLTKFSYLRPLKNKTVSQELL